MAVPLWLPGQGTLNQVRVLELAKLSSGAAVGCCPGHLGSGLDEVARLCSNSFPNGLAHSKAEIGMPSTSRVCVCDMGPASQAILVLAVRPPWLPLPAFGRSLV